MAEPNRSLMASLYAGLSETVDELPYTPAFDSFYERYCKESKTTPSRNEFWRTLTNMRKHKGLVRKKR